MQRRVLAHWLNLLLAIDRSRRCEHQSLDSGISHCRQQTDRTPDVDLVVLDWMEHRLGHTDPRRQLIDAIHTTEQRA